MEEWAPKFLEALANAPNVAAAARAAGVSRTMAYKRRETDAEFRAAWDDALDQSTDELVGEMYRRAKEGVEKPVFYEGEECGRVRVYSDSLAMFLLKAHRPRVYADRMELSGAEGKPLAVTVYLPDNGREPVAPGAAGDPQMGANL